MKSKSILLCGFLLGAVTACATSGNKASQPYNDEVHKTTIESIEETTADANFSVINLKEAEAMLNEKDN